MALNNSSANKNDSPVSKQKKAKTKTKRNETKKGITVNQHQCQRIEKSKCVCVCYHRSIFLMLPNEKITNKCRSSIRLSILGITSHHESIAL